MQCNDMSQMAQQQRIDSTILEGFCMARISKKTNSTDSSISSHYIWNDDRPNKAQTTEGLSRLERQILQTARSS